MLERISGSIAVVLLVGAAACGGKKNCVATDVGVCTPEGELKGSAPGSTTVPSGGVGPIAPAGAVPNGAHLSIDCTPFNVPAFMNSDCLYSHWGAGGSGTDGIVDCTVKLADANGLVIGTPTPVSFMSEAGAISPMVTTVAYDPKATKPDKMVGHAVGFLEVFGSPLPPDVTPFPGEPSLVHDYGCGMRTANPRDGYVTVIAWARGEEGYVDANLNGRYDAGEPFVDLGEPYVDSNDNGVRDPDEWFLDVNGDGVYTGPNGRWDGDTIIWTQTRVLYSGFPAFLQNTSGLNLLSRFWRPPASPPPPAPTPQPTFLGAVNPGDGTPPKTDLLNYYLTDDRLNPLTSLATFEDGALVGNVSVSRTGPDHTANLLMLSFRLLYCDHPNGGTCYDGPVEDGCRSSPCYVVPEVGLCRTAGCAGLINGNRGNVAITCEKAGPDSVYLSTTIDHVTNTMWVSGTCQPGVAPATPP